MEGGCLNCHLKKSSTVVNMCLVDPKLELLPLSSQTMGCTTVNKQQQQLTKKSSSSKIEDTCNQLGCSEKINTIRWVIGLPQPAHFVAMLGALYLGFTFFPKESQRGSFDGPNAFSSLVYMGTFAAHFGAQMWMTFISGIVLFFTIPRNVFAQVQRVLFPLYFFLNSILALATVVTFLQHHPSDSLSGQQKAQVFCLSLCFLIELGTRLYVVPPLLDSLELRMALESKADVGHEIGRHDPGVLKDNQQYKLLHNRFRKFHGLCAVANLTAVACNVIHLYFIATNMILVR